VAPLLAWLSEAHKDTHALTHKKPKLFIEKRIKSPWLSASDVAPRYTFFLFEI
jgi:hypothetical protein